MIWSLATVRCVLQTKTANSQNIFSRQSNIRSATIIISNSIWNEINDRCCFCLDLEKTRHTKMMKIWKYGFIVFFVWKHIPLKFGGFPVNLLHVGGGGTRWCNGQRCRLWWLESTVRNSAELRGSKLAHRTMALIQVCLPHLFSYLLACFCILIGWKFVRSRSDWL